MELTAFSVEGYRRFVEKTSVKLVGRLIAFVGPNEAGKSSLLQAIASLHANEPFQSTDKPRRSMLVPELSWHFKLEPSDKAAISGIHDTGRLQRVVITRRWKAETSWSFQPTNPQREIGHRVPLAEEIEDRRSLLVERGITASDIDSTTESLRSDADNLSIEQAEGLADLSSLCREAIRAEIGATDEPDDDMSSGGLRHARAAADLDELADRLEAVANLEELNSPYNQAIQTLEDRLPRFCLFAQEDRDLRSEYNLAAVAHSPPAALNHLASLAGLRLVEIRDAAREELRADISTWMRVANRRLEEIFAESWNQTGVSLQVDVDGTILHIQATTPADEGVSSVAERSDGMRWFAALLAYSHGWSGPTVLLADELETHLHYDAQADLIDVLQNQTFADKVLYSTHSFGALPPDLGAGVRVVRQVDAGCSKLENGLWARGSGFSPLLVGMGAAAMGFTPSRRAVVAEGPADAVLLPTLLRQANEMARLDYQVVPGLSVVAASAVKGLQEEAGRIFYLTDSDGGGADLRRMLKDEGVDAAHVFELTPGQTCELEDLVSLEAYVSAVNEEIESWQSTEERLSNALFKNKSLRTKTLAGWCGERQLETPDKVAVAQRLVEAGADRVILDQEKKSHLVRLHSAWSLEAQ